jgi:hypothetical protein
MTEKTGFIDDFVEIKIMISNSAEPIENTGYTGIQDLFETHLKASFNDIHKIKQYGIDTYKIKIGDKLKISPSKWTVQFCKEKNLPLGTDYNYSYEVVDIIIEYFSKNPNSDSGFPLLEMTIELKRI